MISVSSWTASSAPATSEKVTLGWSLVILRARLLPKLITLLLWLPCIDLITNKKSNKTMKIGAIETSVRVQNPMVCGSV